MLNSFCHTVPPVMLNAVKHLICYAEPAEASLRF